MDLENIEILKTKDADLKDILFVQKAAFETDAEANLTAQLLKDKTAQPVVSFLAYDEKKPVGHILFSKASVEGWHHSGHIYLLAPMAVIPEYQRMGIGALLIEKSFSTLKKSGTEMVFVFGDPEYYKRHGFVPEAESFGFAPPFPIPERFSEAWMVQALTIKGLSKNVGKVVCADALNKPEYWEV